MYCITEATWFFKFEVPSWKIYIMMDENLYLISIFEVAISALQKVKIVVTLFVMIILQLISPAEI